MAKPLFSQPKLARRAALAALGLALVLLVLDKSNPGVFSGVRSAAHRLSIPATELASGWQSGYNQVAAAVRPKSSIYAENLRLKAELATANLYLQKNRSLQAEVASLERAYHLTSTPVGKLSVAKVVGIDANPLRHIFSINLGSKDGVFVGQPVVDNAGIMGQVIQVFSGSARIMLLSDSQHSLSVKVERTGQRAIASGMGDVSSLDLQYMPSTADVQVGDRLVTTGLDGVFPEGFLVGLVSHVGHDGTHEFAKVLVQPASLLGDPRYVSLLTLPKPEPKAVTTLKLDPEQAAKPAPLSPDQASSAADSINSASSPAAAQAAAASQSTSVNQSTAANQSTSATANASANPAANPALNSASSQVSNTASSAAPGSAQSTAAQAAANQAQANTSESP